MIKLDFEFVVYPVDWEKFSAGLNDVPRKIAELNIAGTLGLYNVVYFENSTSALISVVLKSSNPLVVDSTYVIVTKKLDKDYLQSIIESLISVVEFAYTAKAYDSVRLIEPSKETVWDRIRRRRTADSHAKYVELMKRLLQHINSNIISKNIKIDKVVYNDANIVTAGMSIDIPKYDFVDIA